ncbi:aminotransferase class V-fold PLP-dependent enzyme [Streptomyces sp. RerS4]|uniref:aminotransferase class V-fold PLP-dependent enzyme n=1 Tax=Streptomyces sp. RerS4 TaxID=2942449 RepID=UPI00201BC2D3|nr:aminotransferase class V-fold PLP-dependent enzyme [Streptomyces sp. RerS4]UQX05387.1 aminotransferase class V-fold PLP-dependent enzyme [Streptomyces sp. RerS4]
MSALESGLDSGLEPDAGPLDPAAFRARFPMLRRTTHLGSCSLGAPSTDVVESIGAMFGALAGTVSPWPEWEVATEDARSAFAAHVGAKPADIALVPHATQGAYQAVSTVDLVRRPRLVVSAEDFPTIAHVALAQRQSGAEVVFVPGGEVEEVVRGYAEAIDARTSMVFLPSATFLRGMRLPVARIAALAHAVGARVFVDAYQSVGVEPVDVAAWDVDYLVAGSQKYMLGVPGLAFLYVRPELAHERDPLLTGWFGRIDPDAFDPYTLDFADGARRLETGNHAVPAAYAAGAALRLLERAGPERVRRHVAALTERAAALLTEAGETLAGPSEPADRGAHLALCDPDPQALSAWLVSRDIRIAPRGAFARISFHYFNNEDDVDLVCAQIRAYREPGGR